MIVVSIIINILSYILPFINEIANVLTYSNIKLFENLYRHCIDKYLIPHNIVKTISKKKLCNDWDTISKLLIDVLALLGIIINIAKNAIQFGYLTSIINGFIVVLISFVLPNLYLYSFIKFIIRYYKLKSKYSYVSIGLFIILLTIGAMIGFEKLIQISTSKIIIDPELEKYIYPRSL
jgi:hypothetical protein